MRTTLVISMMAVAACGGETAPPSIPVAAQTSTKAAPNAPDKPAPPKLGETPADRLGTSPAGMGLKVGDHAGDATVTDITGKAQLLSEIYPRGPTFVVFYRGGWCPFCNQQLHELGVALPEFEKKGIRIVAISVDQPSEEAKTQAKQGVPFPMLSDSKLVAHKAFKIVHVPSDAEQKALAGYGVDLVAFSGEGHKNFATPAVFLVDRSGIVRFAHVDEDYKTRPSPKQLLAVAETALAK